MKPARSSFFHRHQQACSKCLVFVPLKIPDLISFSFQDRSVECLLLCFVALAAFCPIVPFTWLARLPFPRWSYYLCGVDKLTCQCLPLLWVVGYRCFLGTISSALEWTFLWNLSNVGRVRPPSSTELQTFLAQFISTQTSIYTHEKWRLFLLLLYTM